ncbi:MAG: DUF6176 family protein [bacterium]|nr:DUF6176 family protein [bacterium]
MAEQMIRVRLKPGQVNAFKSWVAQRQAYRAEFRAALAELGVTYEMLALEELKDGTWLLFYIEAEDLKAASEALKASQHPYFIDFKAWISLAWETDSLKLHPVLFSSHTE